MPEIHWLRGNREVLDGGRFRIMTEAAGNIATLLIGKCRNQDDGTYTVSVENSKGKDEGLQFALFVFHAQAIRQHQAANRRSQCRSGLPRWPEEVLRGPWQTSQATVNPARL